MELTYSQDYKGVAGLRRLRQKRESKMARKSMRKVRKEFNKVKTVIAGVQKVQIKDKEEPEKG